jgi:hypothetical protein
LISASLAAGPIWPVPNSGNFDAKASIQMAKDAFVQLKDIKYLSQAYEMQGGEYMTWNMHRLWSPFGAYDGRARSGEGRLSISLVIVLGFFLFL